MMRPRSSWLAIKRSNHLRRMMLRSLPVLLRQAGQAALAAAMAASASSGAEVGNVRQLAAGSGVHHIEAFGSGQPLPIDQCIGLEQAGVFEQGKGGSLHVHDV